MQVVSACIPVLVVWMTISTMELCVSSNAIAVHEMNHRIWLRNFLEHLWGVYEENMKQNYMVYFLGLMIIIFINGDALSKRFLWLYNGDVPRNVSIPKRCWEKGNEPSNKAINWNLGMPRGVQRSSNIKLDDLFFFVWNFMVIKCVIGDRVSASEKIFEKENVVYMLAYHNIHCGRSWHRLLIEILWILFRK